MFHFMKLLDYMKSKQIDDEAFAALVGPTVTPRAVRKWKYGETCPRIPELVRIVKVTEGHVTSEDFLPPESEVA
jgi:hypothetical protein